MLLVSNKTPTFEIVIASDAPQAVRYAAEELQRYIDRIALALPTIRDDRGDSGPREVLVGESVHSRRLFPEISASQLKREGYILKSRGGHMLILGGSPRGTLYGVYDLLERFGVRWWTPHEEHVPRLTTLAIDDLDFKYEPPLIYRATWYRHAMDADWQARVRLNAGTMGPVHLRERHGGMERFAADASGHTYEGLVPTDQFFDSHPEYFSEVKGVRLRHMNQLCPTHPDVARIAADNARKWLDGTPGANIISVTQNDWGNWCTCATCTLLLEKTGAPLGPMLHLANEVARLLEPTHPHALVDTFAYAWSQTPPQNIKAHPNVLIRIAPIGNCFGHTIRKCPSNRPCFDAVKAWSEIAQHLFVWHYVADFFHYFPPFPNLPPLQDDLRFYIEHGVKGVFMQGDGTSLGGDMAELKAYVIARLMWNPSLKAADIRRDFIEGYYGAAAPEVEEYLQGFEKDLIKSKEHLHLYRSLGENTAAYLKLPALNRARATLAKGRKAVADDPLILERLDRIEMGLDYTELFYHERPAKRVLRGKQFDCSVSPHRKLLAERMFEVADRRRITHYAEDLGRYTTIGELRGAWLDSIGKHEALQIEAGGTRAVVVPQIGGRVVEFGPAKSKLNLLSVGSPATFGYPCCGGYEEYTQRNHQSPGFSQAFEVVKKSRSEITLRATMESALVLNRHIRLDVRTGEMEIATTLTNPTDAPLPGCLRPHLEIDLQTPAKEIEFWVSRKGTWSRDTTSNLAGFSWHEVQVPDAWLFWSPRKSLGVVQHWSKDEATTVYLGMVGTEKSTVALDLARSRYNETIQPGKQQSITHRFAWLKNKPDYCH